MPRNTVPEITNYPETFKALAAEGERYLDQARAVVERAYALLDRLAVENDVEWYSDEFHALEVTYGFGPLWPVVAAVDPD